MTNRARKAARKRFRKLARNEYPLTPEVLAVY
jgi:hypothetical protein